jgi:hypothetical protein
MPVPDFSPGEVLTAAAMDSIGLWLVKTQTISNGVSTVVVSDAFSSTYDNYLITASGGGNSSGSAVIQIQLGNTVTGYKFALIYNGWNATTTSTGNTNGANFAYAGSADPNSMWVYAILRSPNLAKWTSMSADASRTSSYWGTAGGLLENTTQYTGFSLLNDNGTFTGGTIRVYGYRN